jgi:hypothetical protein
MCGEVVWRNTAVVGVLFPAMLYNDTSTPGPCNACAGLEVLASRTTDGWVVWYTL